MSAPEITQAPYEYKDLSTHAAVRPSQLGRTVFYAMQLDKLFEYGEPTLKTLRTTNGLRVAIERQLGTQENGLRYRFTYSKGAEQAADVAFDLGKLDQPRATLFCELVAQIPEVQPLAKAYGG